MGLIDNKINLHGTVKACCPHKLLHKQKITPDNFRTKKYYRWIKNTEHKVPLSSGMLGGVYTTSSPCGHIVGVSWTWFLFILEAANIWTTSVFTAYPSPLTASTLPSSRRIEEVRRTIRLIGRRQRGQLLGTFLASMEAHEKQRTEWPHSNRQASTGWHTHIHIKSSSAISD